MFLISKNCLYSKWSLFLINNLLCFCVSVWTLLFTCSNYTCLYVLVPLTLARECLCRQLYQNACYIEHCFVLL
ncbi:hypothetical protein XELAEV_18012622mg [Xenopus laevis]|uniref:Uncharacterized protein n=1 Tax=Xenopus laevis TaxID=8355 RepID=A0A974HYJ2_XENLA|nr:hypothetical protein XELAEV_18012622mg [Xenopus laevis]